MVFAGKLLRTSFKLLAIIDELLPFTNTLIVPGTSMFNTFPKAQTEAISEQAALIKQLQAQLVAMAGAHAEKSKEK